VYLDGEAPKKPLHTLDELAPLHSEPHPCARSHPPVEGQSGHASRPPACGRWASAPYECMLPYPRRSLSPVPAAADVASRFPEKFFFLDITARRKSGGGIKIAPNWLFSGFAKRIDATAGKGSIGQLTRRYGAELAPVVQPVCATSPNPSARSDQVRRPLNTLSGPDAAPAEAVRISFSSTRWTPSRGYAPDRPFDPSTTRFHAGRPRDHKQSSGCAIAGHLRGRRRNGTDMSPIARRLVSLASLRPQSIPF